MRRKKIFEEEKVKRPEVNMRLLTPKEDIVRLSEEPVYAE